jgi:fimbrial chaperone protein
MKTTLGFQSVNAPSAATFFLIVMLTAVAGQLSGFGFEPITQDFDPSGPGSVQTFTVTNPSTTTLAVRITALSRGMDIEGTETLLPAGQLFLVYPSRVVLTAESTQAVKIQWQGAQNISVEQSYRILVEQVPVDSVDKENPGGSIKVLFRYLGAIYIVPKDAQPNISIESVLPSVNAAGSRGLELVFINKGTSHAILDKLVIIVSEKSGSLKKEFSGEVLNGISGENMLAGLSRRFFLPLPDAFQGEDVDVQFHFTPIR